MKIIKEGYLYKITCQECDWWDKFFEEEIEGTNEMVCPECGRIIDFNTPYAFRKQKYTMIDKLELEDSAVKLIYDNIKGEMK